MNPIYEKLFDTYGDSVLQDFNAYNEDEINAILNTLPLDNGTKVRLDNLFFDYYYRWSTDAFTVGLHLGLSLLHDDVRRIRPQQV